MFSQHNDLPIGTFPVGQTTHALYGPHAVYGDGLIPQLIALVPYVLMNGVPEHAAHSKETSQYKLKAMHKLMYTNNNRKMEDADFGASEQTAWNKKILRNFLSLVTLDAVINSCAPTERITKTCR